VLQRAWSSLRETPRSRVVVLGVVIVAAVAIAVIVVLIKVVPPWVASTDHLSGKDRAEEIGRARTAFLAILAGGIATVGAVFTGLAYRINRQSHELDRQAHELDRAGQITERFTRAIDQLGRPELDVRLGGIYALERIARDSEDDHPQVVEVLTAYVREHAAWPPKPATAAGPTGSETLAALIEAIRALERIAKGSQAEAGAVEAAGEPAQGETEPEAPQLATDVQAAMSVLGRRDASRDKAGARLELAGTDLRRAELVGANLQSAHLHGANLQDANLGEANLEDAGLGWANLRHAHLFGANLQGADLTKANLQDAHLSEANLQRARLGRANLQDAYLVGANIKDARYDDLTIWPKGFDLSVAGGRWAG
jgi:Pentapeptide repeats (8 copies)